MYTNQETKKELPRKKRDSGKDRLKDVASSGVMKLWWEPTTAVAESRTAVPRLNVRDGRMGESSETECRGFQKPPHIHPPRLALCARTELQYRNTSIKNAGSLDSVAADAASCVPLRGKFRFGTARRLDRPTDKPQPATRTRFATTLSQALPFTSPAINSLFRRTCYIST